MLADRRRRVKNIIRILSARAIEHLDIPEDSWAENLCDTLCDGVRGINTFPDNTGYSKAQTDVWDILEAIECATYTPEELTGPTEQNYHDWTDALEAALNNL